MSEWLANNWEWVLVGFYTIEKIVKLSPSKKDDIIFDAIIKPMFNMFKPKKYLNKRFYRDRKLTFKFIVLSGISPTCVITFFSSIFIY